LATDTDELAGQASTFEDGNVAWMLPAGEVHVWRASLERPARVVELMYSTLSTDERARADRFHFARDRSRFVIGRALLRRLLGCYTGATPEALEFEYGEFDKPSLLRGPRFNLSHSGTIALYAVSREGEIGIDVELDRDVSRDRVAERFFSPGEVKALRALPAELQPRAFLSCWTRKEAFLKARGDGLSLALDSFDVTLTPDAPAALLRTAWCSEEPRRWQIQDLSDPQAGYIAAVALRGYGWRVVQREIADTIEGGMPGQEWR